MNAPSVAIIILNWNGKNDTLDCAESIRNVRYPNYKAIIVDNGSTDDSVEVIRERFQEILVLEAGDNLGYAGGNNVGIEFGLDGDFEYILLLNNDTTVAPDFLEPLVEAMEAAPEAAASQPKLYYQDEPEMLWCTGASFDQTKLDFVFENHKVRDDHHSFERVTPVQICVGAALMLRASAIREIGSLDPDLFLMHEESDWCFRARKHGHICLFVPRSRVWHKVSASLGVASPLMVYFGSRNMLRWAKRHLGLRDWARLLLRTARQAFNLPTLKAVFSCPTRNPLNCLKHIYWNIAKASQKTRTSWPEHQYIARRTALRDYLLGRFGDCPELIRQLKPSKNDDSHA